MGLKIQSGPNPNPKQMLLRWKCFSKLVTGSSLVDYNLMIMEHRLVQGGLKKKKKRAEFLQFSEKECTFGQLLISVA